MKKKKLSTVPTGKVNTIFGLSAEGIKQSADNINAAYDNLFIMYHQKSNDFPVMVKLDKWGALQAAGEVADGVVVVEGGRHLVISPTQPATLNWSSAAITGGGVATTDRVTAVNDWAGKTNTSAQIAASSAAAITNTAAYAPGYCNLYSVVNVNNKGLTAGKWWLPSLGELMMIYANMRKINYALGLIAGSNPLIESPYWSSTENSATYAWYLFLSNGTIFAYFKATSSTYVRPVSAFIS